MKHWQKVLALCAIFMFIYSSGFAQGLVKGKVIDEDGSPLPGVNIVIEGTTTGVITDFNGEFSIQAEVGQTLLVRFIGMKPQTVEIKSTDTFLDLTLETEVTQLQEMVVVGYGTQKKESVVGAISTVSSEDLRTQGNVSTMSDALTGVMPGVSVLSVSGIPGGDYAGIKVFTPAEILIRGKTTWNDASPLILVDGIERQMNEVDINDVESVSVLKDASATAVFGVKGGNGVILITTKRGKEGKPQFSVEGEVSFDQAAKLIDVAPTWEAVIARNYAIERSRRFSQSLWNDFYASDEEIGYYRNNTYPYAYASQDWKDIMLKDMAKSYRVNITASGGTKRVRYFISGSYKSEGDLFKNEDLGQGYIPGYTYDRVNVRSNFDFDITKTTRLTANFSGMFGRQSTATRNSGALNGIFPALYRLSGDAPIKVYEDGMPGAQDGTFNAANPWYDFNFTGKHYYSNTLVNMDYQLTQELDMITKGLSFVGKMAYDNTFRTDGIEIWDEGVIAKKIEPEFYLNGGYYDYDTETYMIPQNGVPVPANMNEYTFYQTASGGNEDAGFGWIKEPNRIDAEDNALGSVERNLYYQLQLQYNRSFEKHDVTAMAMFSRQKRERGSNWPRKREDWVGRVTYEYDGRYLLEANGAYNGSEKFGPNYRFDFFPSVAGGWVISNESFMEDTRTWLDKLKVRYSYGLVGNDNVNTGSTWPYLTIWDTFNPDDHEDNGFGYPSPYKEYNRYYEGNPGNPNLRWEKATKQNLGFEFAAFDNKVSFSTELFKEDREDMLIGANDRSSTVPPIFGKPAPPANIGRAKSHGAEVELTYRNRIGNEFNYSVSANWSVARSEVIFKESTELTLPHQKPEGFPLGQTRTSISTGIINSWDDLYAITGGSSSADNSFILPGTVALLDFNADGKYYGPDDNAPYGYPTYPQNNYGINLAADYKGINIVVRFVGAYNATRSIVSELFYFNNTYVPIHVLDATWTPEYNNANPTFPALALDGINYNPRGEFNQFDGSFFRMQSAELGYTFPKQVVQPLRISNLRLYINGRNLFLWTDMPNDGVGFDDPGMNYPTKKQVNIGMRVQF